MTTKQEIIDFLNHPSQQFMNIGTKDYLIQMVKGLKPEIKVKKLVWEIDKPKYRTRHITIHQGWYVQEDDYNPSVWRIVIRNVFYKARFDELEKAQEVVQHVWDKYVLSLVKVEND